MNRAIVSSSVIAGIAIMMLTFANPASALNHEIDDCNGLIDEDGKTYQLTEDLIATGDCLDIDANDVILDCQDYSITGADTGIGINVANQHNVTITNCHVADFQRGIKLSGGGDHTVAQSSRLIILPLACGL